MYERKPTMYGSAVKKAAEDIHFLLDTLAADHPIETELAQSPDPLSKYISSRMQEKRLKGHNMEYVFTLEPTVENLSLITRGETYELER